MVQIHDNVELSLEPPQGFELPDAPSPGPLGGETPARQLLQRSKTIGDETPARQLLRRATFLTGDETPAARAVNSTPERLQAEAGQY